MTELGVGLRHLLDLSNTTFSHTQFCPWSWSPSPARPVHKTCRPLCLLALAAQLPSFPGFQEVLAVVVKIAL